MTAQWIIEKGKETRRTIVNFIIEFIRENGYSPSLRDIQNNCNVSLSNVHRHLEKLESEGVLKRTTSISRTIVIIDPSKYIETNSTTPEVFDERPW